MAEDTANPNQGDVITQPHTLVTLWFVNAADPRSVLDAEPAPDRGFARKYLSQVNPAWPLTHIGDFDMTRSTSPDVHEFYIGAFPEVSVVQTIMPGLLRLSEIPENYRNLVAAADVYATAYVPEDAGESEDSQTYAGLGGFAHWSGGTLKRAFSATRENILEDVGLPMPFEMPFWEGNAEATGIQLPFIPHEIAAAAAEEWLGFRTDGSGPSIHISAFATDGRPETKSRTTDPSRIAGARSQSAEDSGLSGTDDGASYDDYTPGGTSNTEVKPAAELAKDVAAATGRLAVRGAKQAWGGRYGIKNMGRKLRDEAQRLARNSGRN
ncbi:DUF6928 family protein [Corynebacterium urealyticum]|uniref:DUF6928 family protein n=1 Tax=Corynebacterium urealyticum TaxID=43771 RepID=UPI0011E8482F|nr:hypothetical protein [Corynebacterium urealyticum]TYR16484.1 hypothetical protein FYJ89_08680 [Corynebacterium urealyticum]TYT21557.1 hypothetical protein FYJ86_01985 [Corynebacterium urealyticum]